MNKKNLRIWDVLIGIGSGILCTIVTVSVIIMTESPHTAGIEILLPIVLAVAVVFISLSKLPSKSLVRALISLLTYTVTDKLTISLQVPYRLIMMIFGSITEDNNAAGLLILFQFVLTILVHIVLIVVYTIKCIIKKQMYHNSEDEQSV